jgi:hypothetical protein
MTDSTDTLKCGQGRGNVRLKDKVAVVGSAAPS